MQTPEDQQTTN